MSLQIITATICTHVLLLRAKSDQSEEDDLSPTWFEFQGIEVLKLEQLGHTKLVKQSRGGQNG